MYDKYEVVAKQYAVFNWRTLNRLSLFPQVAQVVVPTNAYWLKKYNQEHQSFQVMGNQFRGNEVSDEGLLGFWGLDDLASLPKNGQKGMETWTPC
ncbi:hypothetical protein Goklo_008653 [Gossypium klotzschianum]|uniref:Uncharacterized protein n=1 Tax=Gossypium klotzschianum TaxID=34286 RepID=A0A7J8V1D1_9ROSI|nr:hypothetical protein [Gossypium klotzschianum]